MTQHTIMGRMNRPLLLLSLALSLNISVALAQSDMPPEAEVKQVAPIAAAPAETAPPPTPGVTSPISEDEVMQDTEVTVMKDNFAESGYVTPNMENLSKLYWKLNVFTLDNNSAIDNFLIINECDIYKNFFTDDFEWSNIRESTRAMLKEKIPSYSTQFKILVPIDLGRYDMQRGGFDLVSKTAFLNSRRIQVTSSNSAIPACAQKQRKTGLEGYPPNVIMILNKPFTFDFVKVDEHVAQAFLLRKKYNRTPVPDELRNRGYQRIAYARMRVTFVRYQGTVRERNVDQAILYGKLDGIDIFEDPHEEMLLTSINYD